MARILFIDDDRMIMESYVEALEDRGHDVSFVDNLEDAVLAIEKTNSSFDMIVLDLALAPSRHFMKEWQQTSDMPGWLFRNMVRQNNKNVLIVFLTNFPSRLHDLRAQFGDRDHGFPKLEMSPDLLARQLTQLSRS
jgi:CheY-like chemotaxis protein